MSVSENIVQYSSTSCVAADPALGHAQKGSVQLAIAEYYSPLKVCVCVCCNANPLHYYVLRVPRKLDRWR